MLKKVLNVLVIDDHPLFRDGLAASLGALAEQTEVLTADNAAQGLTLADARPELDLVLLDLSMPGMNGFEAIGEFARRAPGVPVVVVSGHEREEDIRCALGEGALGYVPKSTPPGVLLDALRLVLGGGIYVPPALLRTAPQRHPPDNQTFMPPPAAGATNGAELLTPRQLDVLRLVCEGQSNKLIARALALSEKTVKAHVTAVFRALGVINRTQAALRAREQGLL